MKVHEMQDGQVFGHPYTVIPCEFFDYRLPEDLEDLWRSEELKKVNLWCWEAFGEQGEPYDYMGAPHRWYQQKGQFWFRDAADVAWFRLKWL
jgi:hypothetical protein